MTELTDFEPKIVAFVCTYCAYTAADLAGSLRMSYPSSVRIIKMTCTGKLDPIFLLRSLEEGADAVMVAGCDIGGCHFQKGNLRAKLHTSSIKKRMTEIGIEPERLDFFHVAASQPNAWVDAVNEMTDRVKRLGPSPFRKTKKEEKSI